MAELKRISDKTLEARGVVLYTDEEWYELYVDMVEGCSLDTLYEYLPSRQITEGVDDVKVAKLLEDFQNGQPVHKELIAKGTPMKPGKDGKLEFLIDMTSNKVEVVDDEGNMDFRDLNLIKEIYSGNPICKVTPPEKGVEGVTIQGKHINPPEGNKAKIRLGKNVRFDEEAGTVYATADGHVEYVEPLISVQEEFVVNKDVDYTIGNLKFIGSLAIHGEIPPGYTMEAGKDIYIQGIVNGSNLLAKGNITAENGIIGSEKTVIECDGNLKAKILNEAFVKVKGDVEVQKEVVRSSVKALGCLVIESGAVRGGEIYAVNGVNAKELGSPLGTPTYVAVGVDFSVDERIERLQQAKEKVLETVEALKKAIDPFMKNKLLLVKASEEKKSAVKTILNKIDAAKKKVKQIEQMITTQEVSRHNRTKVVTINGEILDDVTIQIGNKKKKFVNFGKRKGSILYDKASFEIVFSRS